MTNQEILQSVFAPDFLTGLAGLPDRALKDRARIEAFFGASGMKLSQYAQDAMEAVQLGDLDRATFLLGQANTFRISAAHLAGEAASIVSGLGKFQFPKDLWSDKYKDPFKPWREKVRGFARTWDMDPVFRDMLG